MVVQGTCLNGSTIPVQLPTPDAKIPRDTELTCIIASPMLCQGQANGGGSCIIAKLMQCSSLANFLLQVRNAVNKATDTCV